MCSLHPVSISISWTKASRAMVNKATDAPFVVAPSLFGHFFSGQNLPLCPLFLQIHNVPGKLLSTVAVAGLIRPSPAVICLVILPPTG